jgi:hypothetical protein
MSKVLESTDNVRYTIARLISHGDAKEWLWIDQSPRDQFKTQAPAFHEAETMNSRVGCRTNSEGYNEQVPGFKDHPFFVVKVESHLTITRLDQPESLVVTDMSHKAATGQEDHEPKGGTGVNYLVQAQAIEDRDHGCPTPNGR